MWQDESMRRLLRENLAVRESAIEIELLLGRGFGDPHPKLRLRELETRLTDFEEQLRNHFRLEETTGVFERLCGHAPHVAERARALPRQHRELLQIAADVRCHLAELVERDRDPGAEVVEEVRSLLRLLRRHEALENELIELTAAPGGERVREAGTETPLAGGGREVSGRTAEGPARAAPKPGSRCRSRRPSA